MREQPAYQRILLKLSGEAFTSNKGFGIDQEACNQIANAIFEIHELGVEIGVVVGGGNIFRGADAKKFNFPRTPADHIGMLATAINGIILSQILRKMGAKAHVMSALHAEGVIEPYNWSEATQYLEMGHIVVFVGGTGNPYFTTDTAAAMRCLEIDGQVLMKATKVNGIYDKDPMKDKSAKFFRRLTYQEVITRNLKVMDMSAIALCRENRIPIHVFNLFTPGAMRKAICQKEVGTLVTGE